MPDTPGAPKPPAPPADQEIPNTRQENPEVQDARVNESKDAVSDNKSRELLSELVNDPSNAPADKKAEAHFLSQDKGFFGKFDTVQPDESPVNNGNYYGVDPVYQDRTK